MIDSSYKFILGNKISNYLVHQSSQFSLRFASSKDCEVSLVEHSSSGNMTDTMLMLVTNIDDKISINGTFSDYVNEIELGSGGFGGRSICLSEDKTTAWCKTKNDEHTYNFNIGEHGIALVDSFDRITSPPTYGTSTSYSRYIDTDAVCTSDGKSMVTLGTRATSLEAYRLDANGKIEIYGSFSIGDVNPSITRYVYSSTGNPFGLRFGYTLGFYNDNRIITTSYDEILLFSFDALTGDFALLDRQPLGDESLIRDISVADNGNAIISLSDRLISVDISGDSIRIVDTLNTGAVMYGASISANGEVLGLIEEIDLEPLLTFYNISEYSFVATGVSRELTDITKTEVSLKLNADGTGGLLSIEKNELWSFSLAKNIVDVRSDVGELFVSDGNSAPKPSEVKVYDGGAWEDVSEVYVRGDSENVVRWKNGAQPIELVMYLEDGREFNDFIIPPDVPVRVFGEFTTYPLDVWTEGIQPLRHVAPIEFELSINGGPWETTYVSALDDAFGKSGCHIRIPEGSFNVMLRGKVTYLGKVYSEIKNIRVGQLQPYNSDKSSKLAGSNRMSLVIDDEIDYSGVNANIVSTTGNATNGELTMETVGTDLFSDGDIIEIDNNGVYLTVQTAVLGGGGTTQVLSFLQPFTEDIVDGYVAIVSAEITVTGSSFVLNDLLTIGSLGRVVVNGIVEGTGEQTLTLSRAIINTTAPQVVRASPQNLKLLLSNEGNPLWETYVLVGDDVLAKNGLDKSYTAEPGGILGLCAEYEASDFDIDASSVMATSQGAHQIPFYNTVTGTRELSSLSLIRGTYQSQVGVILSAQAGFSSVIYDFLPVPADNDPLFFGHNIAIDKGGRVGLVASKLLNGENIIYEVIIDGSSLLLNRSVTTSDASDGFGDSISMGFYNDNSAFVTRFPFGVRGIIGAPTSSVGGDATGAVYPFILTDDEFTIGSPVTGTDIGSNFGASLCTNDTGTVGIIGIPDTSIDLVTDSGAIQSYSVTDNVITLGGIIGGTQAGDHLGVSMGITWQDDVDSNLYYGIVGGSSGIDASTGVVHSFTLNVDGSLAIGSALRQDSLAIDATGFGYIVHGSPVGRSGVICLPNSSEGAVGGGALVPVDCKVMSLGDPFLGVVENEHLGMHFGMYITASVEYDNVLNDGKQYAYGLVNLSNYGAESGFKMGMVSPGICTVGFELQQELAMPDIHHYGYSSEQVTYASGNRNLAMISVATISPTLFSVISRSGVPVNVVHTRYLQDLNSYEISEIEEVSEDGWAIVTIYADNLILVDDAFGSGSFNRDGKGVVVHSEDGNSAYGFFDIQSLKSFEKDKIKITLSLYGFSDYMPRNMTSLDFTAGWYELYGLTYPMQCVPVVIDANHMEMNFTSLTYEDRFTPKTELDPNLRDIYKTRQRMKVFEVRRNSYL